MTHGWPWDSNARAFLLATLLVAFNVHVEQYAIAAAFALLAVGVAVDQICLVIKQQGKASDHQS